MSKEAMKRFLIETSVENAEGNQTWYVDATSEAEALEQYEQGGCDLYASNVEATALGEPEISGETTLDDFGDFGDFVAQPAPATELREQEPVAYWIPKAEQFCIAGPSGRPFAKAWEPLYTSPPAQRTWVGLTDVEWMNIVNKDQAWFGQRPDEVTHEVAKLVEAKLKEKNR